MIISRRAPLTRYGAAALAVGVSLAANLWLGSAAGVDGSHLLYLAAVILAAWYGGAWAGLAATCLAAICAALLPPAAGYSLAGGTAGRGPQLLLFVLEGTLISAVSGSLGATRRRAVTHSEEARLYRDSSQQTTESLRHVIESVHDHAIFMIDAGGRVASWNEGAERLLGYAAGEIVGQDFSRLYTPEDVARGAPERELKIARNEGRAAERRWHVRGDGARFWGDGVLKAVRDAEGRLRGFSRMVRDTTERWQAEEALRQSEERFRIVARATNDAVWDWNLQTNKVWWNDSVTTLFGYSREEVSCEAAADQGATWWYRHIHAEDRDRVVASIYATITNREQEWSAEYRFGRRGGGYADIYDRGFVVYDERNEPARMIGSMMDITERKRAEQERAALLALEREARAEAEKANGVKDEFLAMVSHELRTPLTTIKMMTRLMQREAVSEEERRECLEGIATACDREIALVLNLLDLSRAEAGALDLQPAPVEAAEILDACVKLERHAAAARGHRLLVELPPERLPPLRADRRALRRVLCNLVENAIKYTPDGGRITLRARAAGREVALGVSDTGRGIAPEDLPRLFEKFYRGRAARPTRPETPGVGLGLYLSQRIVRQLGGRLDVESSPGAGSTFTVRLPAWRDEETRPGPGESEAHEAARVGG